MAMVVAMLGAWVGHKGEPVTALCPLAVFRGAAWGRCQGQGVLEVAAATVVLRSARAGQARSEGELDEQV